MDRFEYKSMRQDRSRSSTRESNPSFSSTLLDAIYRSIDESNRESEEDLIFYRDQTMRKKQQPNMNLEEDDLATLKRACLVEKWMEKKVSEKIVVRRKSMADFDRSLRNNRDSMLLMNSSTSSSSDSSNFSGGLSSSEAESIYGANSRSSNFNIQRPKPIRTSLCTKPQKSEKVRNFEHQTSNHSYYQQQIDRQKLKKESNFVKTKSKALKIYSDLKKVKQPISPGGRLSSFLNSIFTHGNTKKIKKASSSSSVEGYNINNASTCSSATSFSRSCLSKTPSSSSTSKLSSNGGTKRSVRFYPVSIILDEDCRPCGHKSLYGNDQNHYGFMEEVKKSARSSINEDDKFHFMGEKHRLVEETRRNADLDMKDINQDFDDSDVDDDDDDDASYASSDLFELDNLGNIGIDRYREELPVYETTNFNRNRAIANGLIV